MNLSTALILAIYSSCSLLFALKESNSHLCSSVGLRVIFVPRATLPPSRFSFAAPQPFMRHGVGSLPPSPRPSVPLPRDDLFRVELDSVAGDEMFYSKVSWSQLQRSGFSLPRFRRDAKCWLCLDIFSCVFLFCRRESGSRTRTTSGFAGWRGSTRWDGRACRGGTQNRTQRLLTILWSVIWFTNDLLTECKVRDYKTCLLIHPDSQFNLKRTENQCKRRF